MKTSFSSFIAWETSTPTSAVWTQLRRKVAAIERGCAGPLARAVTLMLTLFVIAPAGAQTLINVDFGVGTQSSKIGFAATGQSTNDYWNLYHQYQPKFIPGMPLVSNGTLTGLRMSDGVPSQASISVTNAPGVWGNASGDPMFDTFIFAQNGSNITVTLRQLDPGRYHFYLYGHADPDVTGEQNSVFTIRSGTNTYGSRTASGGSGWKSPMPWQEGSQYVVFRDVAVSPGMPVVIEVAPGPNGIAVLNGLQIISRGTSPPKIAVFPGAETATDLTNLVFRSVRYQGQVSDDEARLEVDLQVQSYTTNRIVAPLFEGDVAVVAPTLPLGLDISSAAKRYALSCTVPGIHDLHLEVVAKITRAEPWNSILFFGPEAAIASVNVRALAPDVEMQLLRGTQLASDHGSSRLEGFLGGDRALSMRWQSKTAEIARKSLLTVDTQAKALVTPTVIKLETEFRYQILQASAPKLSIALPASQALTRIVGEQIRDWSVKPEGDHQLLSVEFIKPVEKSYQLAVYTEQNIDATPVVRQVSPPEPLDVQHESGSLSVSADEMTVEAETPTGLRQVNAAPGSILAYRFYGRPSVLSARLTRVEPVVTASDRVTLRVEENRIAAGHALTLEVEKAGIYGLELIPPSGFNVLEVRGQGVDDWSTANGRLRVNFSSRVLGSRELQIQLEQAFKTFPAQITNNALHVINATREKALIGASSSLGIRIKTAELGRAREIPVSALPGHSDELLAYSAEGSDWKVSFSTERLPARIVAEVFNLVTIGDGLVGGSATIRYSLINQGVQQFQLRLPAHWKNVEFIGANIRRKETNAPSAGATADTNYVGWTIGLQDKAWGGYTLVVTYDYQFNAKQANLNLAGAHPLGVERETGSIAITAAANMELTAQPSGPLRLMDQSELSQTDRAFITRPVLLAYQYTSGDFNLSATRTRHEELPVLDAVADRTQLTSTFTEDGQMITQASFMVKNNDKQFQRFLLPADAQLWACYVNGQASKAEKDGEWMLVSLPRGANRDEPFAVDLVYKQNIGSVKTRLFSKNLQFTAPKTDVPNTYAEWQFFVPPNERVSRFGGAMSISRENAPYTLREAWKLFVDAYASFFRESGPGAVVSLCVIGVLVAIVVAGVRSGARGIVVALALVLLAAILAGMMLPALGKAKAKAQRISAVSNMKNVAMAARLWANDNGDRLPRSIDEFKSYLGSERVLIDPETGQRIVYAGAGKTAQPDAVLAYTPNERLAAMGDGSVRQLSPGELPRLLNQEQSRSNAISAESKMAGSKPLNRAEQTPNTAEQSKGVAGGLGGGGFMLGGIDGAPLAASAPATEPAATGPAGAAGGAPVSAGRRSIHIDIPRLGQSFSFTKVLNLNNAPLTVQMSVERMKAFRVKRSIFQVLAFVLGLGLVWSYWHRRPLRAFPVAIGLALALGAVGSLLIAAEALHIALIASVPALAAIVALGVLLRFWRRRARSSSIGLPGPTPGASPIPPAIAGIVLLILSASPSMLAADKSAALGMNVPEFMNSYTIVSAAYQGQVRNQVGTFEADLEISAMATNQVIRLFGREIAIQEFTSDSKEASLFRQGPEVALRLPQAGHVKVHLKFAAKTGGDVAHRNLAFSIPPALSSKVALTIDEPDAAVEFPSAVAVHRLAKATETSIEAVLGAGDQVDVTWTPRVKRVAETAATIAAQNACLITAGGGAVNIRSILDYQINQGELRQPKVRLPANQRLLRVDGEGIRTWELRDEAGGQVLIVDLAKAAVKQYRLNLELESPLDKLPALINAQIPHAADVARESGMVAVQGSEEIALTIDPPQGLQRVDTAEFLQASGLKAQGIVAAYRFFRPNFELRITAAAVKPEVEAAVHTIAHLGFEQIALATTVNYTIKKAGVFALQLALPAEYTISSVVAEHLQQWTEKQNPRVLELTLSERTLGALAVQIHLVKEQKELPKTIELSGVQPLQADKMSGDLLVSSEQGIAASVRAFEGLMEISAASFAPARRSSGNSSLLAFKFSSTAPQSAAAWKLSVNTESVESWVRAEILDAVSVSESLVSGRAQVRYDIQNAPLKDFFITLPPGSTNVEISGTNIRRRDPGASWHIELQGKVRGMFELTVTWELPRSLETNAGLTVQGVHAAGVERETGFVVITTKPPLQVSEKSAGDPLKRIDVRELPEWAGFSGSAPPAGREAPVLVYRYLRPGFQLSLEARRFEDAAILQALVDSTQLTTVVADDGQMMTQLSLSLRNNGLQYVELELPPSSIVWSAFVAGQPVRPGTRAGKLLLPLEGLGADGAPVAIELTFVSAERFPKTKGEVRLASPRLSVPLKNARWDLYLPPDYRYSQFEGSMSHEALGQAVVQVYSGSEYVRQENESRTAKQAEIQNFLSNARKQLAEGKLKSAGGELQQAFRLNGNQDRETKQELDALKKVITRSQSSNLIQAQNSSYFSNAGRLAASDLVQVQQVQQQAKVPASETDAYGLEVAEQQSGALQRAQEIAMPAVEPLHVNLPTRGERHAFTQVLQTEVNKPMTIEFSAVNLNHVSLFKRFVLSLAAFVLLWIGTAAALRWFNNGTPERRGSPILQ